MGGGGGRGGGVLRQVQVRCVLEGKKLVHREDCGDGE